MNASYVLKLSVVECRSIYLIDSMDPPPTSQLTPDHDGNSFDISVDFYASMYVDAY